MNKLVTVGLNGCEHGKVEEHLEKYFSSGWKVVSMIAVGAAVPPTMTNTNLGNEDVITSYEIPGHVAGWVAVLMEK